MAGAGVESALLQSVIVGFTMLVFTVLAMVVIDRFGRRNLMIAGSLGYIAGLSGAAWAFYAKVEGSLLLVSLLVFIAAHGFGQGAVIWVFISEIFPNRVRARGQALGRLHTLGDERRHLVDLSDNRRRRGLDGVRLLRFLHGRAACLGAAGDAGDQGCVAREDSRKAGYRVGTSPGRPVVRQNQTDVPTRFDNCSNNDNHELPTY